MPDMPPFSLAQLTWLPFSPPELVSLAGRAGYDYAGLRLLPAMPGGVAYALMDDPPMLRETLVRMDDTGVRILDLELIRLTPEARPDAYGRFFETGQRLGAQAVLVAGDDPDEGRLVANFAALCEAARPYGLSADLEFMPWTTVRSAADALRVVEAAGKANAGVLVDALHWARSGSTLADVAAIPAHRLHYAQLCDAQGPMPTTVEGLLHTARVERLLPGEGDIDLVGLCSALPRNLPVSVEMPSQSLAPLGPERVAKLALLASQRLLLQTADHAPLS